MARKDDMPFPLKLLNSECNKRVTEDLYFCQSGWETCDRGYTFGPTAREFYLIHYILSGKGKYYARNQVFELGKNQAFLIHPGEITTYCADMEDPWEYCYISFNGRKALDYVHRMGFTDDSLIIGISDPNLVYQIEETTLKIRDAIFPEVFGLGSLLLILNIFIEANVSRKPRSNAEEYVYYAKSYISHNFARKITVSSIAKLLSLNRSHFCRVFKSETGMSPVQYIAKYRVDKACFLLSSTNLSLLEISDAVGYENYPYFHRTFKFYTGASPKEFRLHSHRSESEPSA